jgi:hypothetical protein
MDYPKACVVHFDADNFDSIAQLVITDKEKCLVRTIRRYRWSYESEPSMHDHVSDLTPRDSVPPCPSRPGKTAEIHLPIMSDTIEAGNR